LRILFDDRQVIKLKKAKSTFGASLIKVFRLQGELFELDLVDEVRVLALLMGAINGHLVEELVHVFETLDKCAQSLLPDQVCLLLVGDLNRCQCQDKLGIYKIVDVGEDRLKSHFQ